MATNLPKDIRNVTTVTCALQTDNVVREYPAMHFGTIGVLDPETGARPTEVYIVLDWTHGTGFHAYYDRPDQPKSVSANTTPLSTLTAGDIAAIVQTQLRELLQGSLPIGPTAPAAPTTPPAVSDPFHGQGAPVQPTPVAPAPAPATPVEPATWTPPAEATPPAPSGPLG